MNELLKEMGQRILERRKQLNMTQETLANLTHLTSQTISYAEMGQKAMRPETMLKICEALGISADYLLRGKILEADTSLLQQKISTLTPSQYRPPPPPPLGTDYRSLYCCHTGKGRGMRVGTASLPYLFFSHFYGKPPWCWRSDCESYHQLRMLHPLLRSLMALLSVPAAAGLCYSSLKERIPRSKSPYPKPVHPDA